MYKCIIGCGLLMVAILLLPGTSLGNQRSSALQQGGKEKTKSQTLAQRNKDVTTSVVLEGSVARVRIKNSGEKPVAVLRYWLVFDVRQFDSAGRQISNLESTLHRLDYFRPFHDEDWAILRPNDEVSFLVPLAPLTPVEAGKKREGAASIQCVIRSGQARSAGI